MALLQFFTVNSGNAPCAFKCLDGLYQDAVKLRNECSYRFAG